MTPAKNPGLLIRAAQGELVETTPVWIMRQAGRYLPEYRALREKVDFLELCKTPELAVQASLMPLKRFALDGAIIFSDILIPVEAMGCPVQFTEGQGPVLPEQIKNAAQIERLRIPEPKEQMAFVLEGISLLAQATAKSHAIIGFAGAPLTLAAYMIEGKSTSGFARLREFIYKKPDLYHQLADKLATTVGLHLRAQLDAGADIVQLFDSWGGILSAAEYRRYALPYVQKALAPALASGKPVIFFIAGGQHLLAEMMESGASVLSIDWRCDIANAKDRAGQKFTLQGNLHPAVLFAENVSEIQKQTRYILAAFPKKQGHIFNLGHGIHPQTPIDNVKVMIEAIKQ